MGVGDVGQSPSGSAANALWVFDDRVFDEELPELRPDVRETDRFVAWPPRGYVPPVLLHPRWSFTLAGADFASARVSVVRLDGKRPPVAIPNTIVHRSGAIGHVPLPTIVWELDLHATAPSIGDDSASADAGRARDGAVDTCYLVLIEDVDIDGETRSFGYEVRVLGSAPSSELTVEEFVARLGS
jgi:hypothetical protein